MLRGCPNPAGSESELGQPEIVELHGDGAESARASSGPSRVWPPLPVLREDGRHHVEALRPRSARRLVRLVLERLDELESPRREKRRLRDSAFTIEVGE